jgi:serine/threonine-protein kinase HipA
MDLDGGWKLSPAYDVIYSHNPAGKWTNQHQMSANGKRDGFTRKDLIALADSISLSRAEEIIDQVIAAVEKWPEYASEAGVKKEVIVDVGRHQRMNI